MAALAAIAGQSGTEGLFWRTLRCYPSPIHSQSIRWIRAAHQRCGLVAVTATTNADQPYIHTYITKPPIDGGD